MSELVVPNPKVTPPLRLDVREAAIRLFAKQGYAATGIRELATACGLSSAALYHYVGSKEDLLFGIMRDGMADTLALAEEALLETTTPTERVTALVEAHVEMHASRRLEALVTDIELRSLSPDRRAEVVAVRDLYERLWRDAIADGVRGGDFTVNDPKLATIAALELCTSVAKWYTPRGSLAIDQIAHEFTGFVLAMLRAKDGRSRSGSRNAVADLAPSPDGAGA